MKNPPLVLLVVFALAALDARALPSDLLKPSTATKTTDDAAAVKLPEYKGVKHAIGIMDFTSQPGFFFDEANRENMRAMLESTLAATGRFVIVERGNLQAVIGEQDLQTSGRAAKSTQVAQTGKIRSARYLASGVITEASASTSGDSGGLNIQGFRIGGSSAKSSIVVVVKLVDSTTSEVVASERIRGEAGHTKLNLGYSGRGFGGDLGTFAKTPMGEAAQDCINQAVLFIAKKMENTPIEGVVVGISGQQVIVNLGLNYGIAAGQTFVVRKQGETLTDPSTGESLGASEGEVVGTIEVTSPKDKLSYCKLVGGALPERGDVVVVK